MKLITNDGHAHYELAEHILDHHQYYLLTMCEIRFFIYLKLKSSREFFKKIADDFGFSIDHRLDLLGTCGECAE